MIRVKFKLLKDWPVEACGEIIATLQPGTAIVMDLEESTMQKMVQDGRIEVEDFWAIPVFN